MLFPSCSPAALIHMCHAITLPFFDSAMSFVKVHAVDRNIQTASLLNKLGTLCGSWKKTNAGRSPTCCLWMADANSHIPCRSHAMLCHGLKKSFAEQHGRCMKGEQLGMCESKTAPLCKSNGKDTTKHLAERHGQGNCIRMPWYVWISLKASSWLSHGMLNGSIAEKRALVLVQILHRYVVIFLEAYNQSSLFF
jgi:hypothetical protein